MLKGCFTPGFQHEYKYLISKTLFKLSWKCHGRISDLMSPYAHTCHDSAESWVWRVNYPFISGLNHS